MAHRLAERQVTRSVAAAVVVGVALFAAASAQAAFPGANGKIAFARFGEIWTVNPDGSGAVKLTDNSESGDVDGGPVWSADGQKVAFYRDPLGEGDTSEVWTVNQDGSALQFVRGQAADPAWSPDGSKIVFASHLAPGELFVMNADGSGPINLTNNAASDLRPNWSPDGSKIAFASNRDGNFEIYVMNADGTAQSRITSNAATDSEPSWSPDGARIAFESNRDGNYEIYAMNANGTGQTRLTNNPTMLDSGPAWAPNGSGLAFGHGPGSIYTMQPDGSEQTNVTSGEYPDWQPLQTYEHPQNASPLHVSLVPLFRQCGTGASPANGQHSPPLGVPACRPPVKVSTQARFGLAAVGSADFTVISGDGDPGNGDQADLGLQASLTDVQTPAGGDYTPNPSGPDVALFARLRLTDRANEFGRAGTTTDANFGVPIDCAATPLGTTGATCAVNTTADAVRPDFAKEGRQAVIQTFRTLVFDGGQNGVPGDADDRILAQQGIYVP